MSERDELARKLDEWLDDEAPLNLRRYVPVADAILAAGYRRPRTVTTVQELDALGGGATILEPSGCVWVNDGQSEDPWASFGEDPWGGPIWTDSSRITLPVTVLREVSK